MSLSFTYPPDESRVVRPRFQVYQRADLNRMLMSMSVGPFCDLAQDVDSSNWTQGAVVSLRLDENERECKCLSKASKAILISSPSCSSFCSRSLSNVLRRRFQPVESGGEPHQGLPIRRNRLLSLVSFPSKHFCNYNASNFEITFMIES